jgi:hypothetical protein
MTKKLAWVCAGLLLAGGCGHSPEAEHAQAADQAAKAAEQAMKDGASGAPSNVKVVPFESLQALLPDMPGWTKGEPKGETETVGVSVSRVQVDYDKGESTLSFEIMDSSMNQALIGPMTALLKTGYSEKTTDGYKRGTTVGGFPGSEEWTSTSKRGVVTALVGGRFIATVTGEGVPDIETVRKAVEAIDLKKLAALK